MHIPKALRQQSRPFCDPHPRQNDRTVRHWCRSVQPRSVIAAHGEKAQSCQAANHYTPWRKMAAGRNDMQVGRFKRALCALAMATSLVTFARADDLLKVAVPQRG